MKGGGGDGGGGNDGGDGGGDDGGVGEGEGDGSGGNSGVHKLCYKIEIWIYLLPHISISILYYISNMYTYKETPVQISICLVGPVFRWQ